MLTLIPVSWRIIAILVLAVGLLLGLNTCTAKDRNHWRSAALDYKRASEGWRASFKASEKLRRSEQRRAVSAISEAEGACDARVDQARRSARTIRQIIERPVATDANNCPLRPVVGTDSLRDALQPAAGAHRP